MITPTALEIHEPRWEACPPNTYPPAGRLDSYVRRLRIGWSTPYEVVEPLLPA